jgi:EpsI family protein
MLTRALIVFSCLLLGAGAVARADRYDHPPSRSTFASFPTQIEQWRGIQQPPFDAETLAVLRVDDYLTRIYVGPDRAGVGLYIGYWASQRQGSTIHSPLNCLPGAGWEPVVEGTLQLPNPRDGSAPPMTVNRVVVQKGIERQLVLYWFQSHGRYISSEYWSKIYLVTDAVRMGRSDGAIVRVIVPVANDTAAARELAEHTAIGFVHDLVPQLDPFLPS